MESRRALPNIPVVEPHRDQIDVLAAAMMNTTASPLAVADVDAGDPGKTAGQAAAKYGVVLAEVALPRARRQFVLLPRRWVLELDAGWGKLSG